MDDPLSDAEWILMEAEDLLENDKIMEGLKKYKTAAIILEGTKHQEKYAELMVKLINLCIAHEFIENAREEMENFEKLKDSLDGDIFESHKAKIRTI